MKQIFPLAIVGALALAAGSCNNTGAGSPKIQLATFQYDTLAYSTEADTVHLPGSQFIKYTGRGVLPIAIDGIQVPSLRDSLMNLANVEFRAGLAVPVIDSTSYFVRNKVDADSIGESFVTDNLSVYLITPQVIVWENYNEYYYYGAAHGMYSTTYLNYSIADRKILSLKDVFMKGYEKELLKMIKEKLSDNKNLLVDAKIEIPSDFCITTDGISFVYQVYEIASYFAGEIRVDFSADELSDILSPEGLKLLGVN